MIRRGGREWRIEDYMIVALLGGMLAVKEAEGFTRSRLVVRRAEDSCLRDTWFTERRKDGRRKDRSVKGFSGVAKLIVTEWN